MPNIDVTNNASLPHKSKVAQDDRLLIIDASLTELQDITAARLINPYDTLIRGFALKYISGTSISVSSGLCVAQNGDVLWMGADVTLSSLSLTPSILYHIYAYLSSGTPAIEVATTAPTAWMGNAYSKTGDTSRRYIGSIYTNASAQVQRFVMYGNTIHYIGALAASPFRILSSGTSTTASAISTSTVVPSTAEAALLRISQSANAVIMIGDNSLATTNYFYLYPSVVSDAQIDYVSMPLKNGIYYMYQSAPSVGSLNMDVIGYIVNR